MTVVDVGRLVMVPLADAMVLVLALVVGSDVRRVREGDAGVHEHDGRPRRIFAEAEAAVE